jgi:hypothetical protein
MLAEILVSEALLPDAPEHPLMTKGREVGADLFLVPGFLPFENQFLFRFSNYLRD